MRERADADRVRRLAAALGRTVPPGTRMYLTGGATAVLEGWRESTVDVDVRFEPDSEAPLRRIAELKEELSVNVELASPRRSCSDFRQSIRSGSKNPSNRCRPEGVDPLADVLQPARDSGRSAAAKP